VLLLTALLNALDRHRGCPPNRHFSLFPNKSEFL
jgi:hypothetical protein